VEHNGYEKYWQKVYRRKTMHAKAKWEQSFEDWERLLKTAGAEELLEDPKAIWDEAWRQAMMQIIETIKAKDPSLAQTIHIKFGI
jgi:hypothetical protein